MDGGFWLGVLCTIPVTIIVGIITNWLSNPARKWTKTGLERMSNARAKRLLRRRVRALRRELGDAAAAKIRADDPKKLLAFGLTKVMGCLAAVIIGLAATLIPSLIETTNEIFGPDANPQLTGVAKAVLMISGLFVLVTSASHLFGAALDVYAAQAAILDPDVAEKAYQAGQEWLAEAEAELARRARHGGDDPVNQPVGSTDLEP
jgi:hypothetical protein